jgi:histone-lysine N-methyltransferase SETMAR
MNSQYFSDVVLEQAKRAVTALTGKSGPMTMDMINMDNCQSLNSPKTIERLQEFQVTRLPHPPHSPDISPCDFWFFSSSKTEMRGQRFQASDDVRTFLSDLSRYLGSDTFISVYHEWIARLEQVIAMGGEYYSKWLTRIE